MATALGVSKRCASSLSFVAQTQSLHSSMAERAQVELKNQFAEICGAPLDIGWWMCLITRMPTTVTLGTPCDAPLSYDV